MSDYNFVNIRFNMEDDEEKVLFSKLNPNNRGGNIKKVLKKFFLLEDENLMKKIELKSIIKEIVDKEMDVREERKIIPSVNQNKKIKIIREERE